MNFIDEKSGLMTFSDLFRLPSPGKH